MSYRPTPEEIAADLPADVGHDDGKKSQMLCVAEILRLFTDEDEGLTAEEIRQAVGLRTGSTPTAAKVRDDIHALANNGAFGMEIKIPSRGEADGFRCTRSFLTSGQARLLINMVRTCKFLDRAQRGELVESLYAMVSYRQQDQIAQEVVVDEREQAMNHEVLSTVDVFSYAIERGLQVRFRDVTRGLGRRVATKSPMLSGEADSRLQETPINLVYSFGNYYAETWAGSPEEGRPIVRRLDRLADAEVVDEPAITNDTILHMRKSVRIRVAETFDMLGGDTSRDLFLKVYEGYARYVYDRFGVDKRFVNLGEDDGGRYGIVHVTVRLSPTFYRWLFGMGDGISLVVPRSPMEAQTLVRHSEGCTKPFGQLCEDYEAAVDGLRSQFQRSASAYGWAVRDNEPTGGIQS